MGILTRKPAAVLDSSLMVRKWQACPIFTDEGAPPRRSVCSLARVVPKNGHDECKTVATTVRLNEDLYLRLKLYATHTDRTRQDIMQCAIDSYLADGALELAGDCGCLNGDKKVGESLIRPD